MEEGCLLAEWSCHGKTLKLRSSPRLTPCEPSLRGTLQWAVRCSSLAALRQVGRAGASTLCAASHRGSRRARFEVRLRLLVVAGSYPFPDRAFAGVFNERSVLALKEMCEVVEVLAPRPFVPPGLSFLHRRWKSYSSIRGRELRNGVQVHRPAYLQVPRIGSGFWVDKGAFLRCRDLMRRRHEQMRFEAILAFDLSAAGGLAWRLAEDLSIPAAGWATGADTRVSPTAGLGRVVKRALRKLNIVFYQSQALRATAASFFGENAQDWNGERHIVLSRGILPPPVLQRAEVRRKARAALGIGEDEQLLLSIGRLTRPKGVFELVDAFALAATRRADLRGVIIGADPAFDDSEAVRRKLQSTGELAGRLSILPACPPDEIWEFLCAADVFAFTSHNEGMPNSLLEAMSMGIPAIAFAISPVKEIEAGTGGLVLVPPLDSERFAEEIVRLAADPGERARIGEIGRAQVFERFLIRRSMAAALARLSEISEGSIASRRTVEGACVPPGG